MVNLNFQKQGRIMALTSVILALYGKFLPYLYYVGELLNDSSWERYGSIPWEIESNLEILYTFEGIMFILAIVFGSVSLGMAKKRGKSIELPLTGLILGIIFLFNIIPLAQYHNLFPWISRYF